MGRACEKGDLVKRNRQEAAHWYRRAALSGDAEGVYELARLQREQRRTARLLDRATLGLLAALTVCVILIAAGLFVSVFSYVSIGLLVALFGTVGSRIFLMNRFRPEFSPAGADENKDSTK